MFQRQKCKNRLTQKMLYLEKITPMFCAASGKDICIFLITVGHSLLNPKELIWVQFKTRVAHENTIFKIEDVKQLTHKALSDVKMNNCKNAVERLKEVEKQFCRTDFVKPHCGRCRDKSD